MYIGNKSRTERPGKTKIGTQVAHVTRDSDTTFKVKRSKVNLQRPGNIVADLHTSLIFINSLIFMDPTAIGSKVQRSTTGVRDGLQLARSNWRTAGKGILCHHLHSLFYCGEYLLTRKQLFTHMELQQLYHTETHMHKFGSQDGSLSPDYNATWYHRWVCVGVSSWMHFKLNSMISCWHSDGSSTCWIWYST